MEPTSVVTHMARASDGAVDPRERLWQGEDMYTCHSGRTEHSISISNTAGDGCGYGPETRDSSSIDLFCCRRDDHMMVSVG